MTQEQATEAFMRGHEKLTPHQAKGCIASTQAGYAARCRAVRQVKAEYLSGNYNRDMTIAALVGNLGYGRQGAARVADLWEAKAK